MANSIVPSQIGSTPISSTNGSQIIFGRDLGGNGITVDFEAIGLGVGGRPDILQKLKINLSTSTDGINYIKTVSIILDPSVILTLIAGNANVPKPLNMILKEVAICEENDGISSEKRMVILGSDSYDAP